MDLGGSGSFIASMDSDRLGRYPTIRPSREPAGPVLQDRLPVELNMDRKLKFGAAAFAVTWAVANGVAAVENAKGCVLAVDCDEHGYVALATMVSGGPSNNFTVWAHPPEAGFVAGIMTLPSHAVGLLVDDKD